MTTSTLVDELLAWYRRSARDLPWRKTRDPYAIWVSEIMLQQTRVETVIPYYERFLARWPTVEELAAEELDEVLRAWAGLGYYRRARQLHLAAAEVVERYGGALPETAEELSTLTGIGRYTAGAIASIAHGEATPVVDGNVIRVLARLRGWDDDMRATKGQRRVWKEAGELVDREAPGDFNQALMELGATVCTPKGPRCLLCPVRAHCVAQRDGRTQELPVLAKKKPPKPQAMVAAVVARQGGELLLAQRAPEGLFGGMWEPPMVESDDLVAARGALRARGVIARAKLVEMGRVTHVLSHRQMLVAVARGTAKSRWRLPEPPAPYQRLAWRRPDDVALSTLATKVIELGVREAT